MLERKVIINLAEQSLKVFDDKLEVIFSASVSTAANGPGEQYGSECTPRGKHIIRAKIGDGFALNTVFVGRRATGEIFSNALQEQHPNRDWILTRILWLSGCEKGVNRLGEVDTMRRFIYIHGCPDDTMMGDIGSHGCIRMLNKDIVKLFSLLPVGTDVLIKET